MAATTTAVGSAALAALTTGTQNVAVGTQAGNAITTGGSNVTVGYGSAPTLATGSSNIVIGQGADVPTASTSNYLNIGGAIKGDMSSTGAIQVPTILLVGGSSNGGSDYPIQGNASTNGPKYIRMYNNNTGASAQAGFNGSTGTANSYFILNVQDNSGSPYAHFACGAGILHSYWDAPDFIFRTPAGVQYAQLSSSGLTLSGLASLNGGTDTSGTAAVSSPSFTSGTAKQLSTAQDCMLYVFVNTSIIWSLNMGPTSTPANQLANSAAAANPGKGWTFSCRVPKGWYVSVTCGTMADLTFTQITC